MALSIMDAAADRRARGLAAATGESLTVAIRAAVRERLRRVEGRTAAPRLRDELRAIRKRCARLPVLDPRSPDEILGYDEHGLPR
jgi:antitoxin VapB